MLSKKTISSLVLCFVLLLSLEFEVANAADLIGNPDPMENMPEIYIRENGSIDPNTAPIVRNGRTYSLIGNILKYQLIIKCDNIILDGKGHTLLGRGHGLIQDTAINLGSSNAEIKNFNIDDFVHGINTSGNSSGCTIAGNSIKNTVFGIDIGFSTLNDKITYNSIMDTDYGIRVFGSYNIVVGNNISNARCGVEFNFGDHNRASNNILSNIKEKYIDISSAPDTVLENNILPVASPRPTATSATSTSSPSAPATGSNYWSNTTFLWLGVIFVIVLVVLVILIVRGRHQRKGLAMAVCRTVSCRYFCNIDLSK